MSHFMSFFWIFGGLSLLGATVATFSRSVRTSALALWFCGLSVGSCFLSVGMEFAAVLQWIISTLVTISLVFFSTMFGEEKTVLRWHEYVLPLLLGTSVVGVFWLGVKDSPSLKAPTFAESGLVEIGQALLQDHVLSLVLLGVILLLVVVGSGVVSRLERDQE